MTTVALVDGDIVTGTASGPGMKGLAIPLALSALPIDRLRVLDGILIDAATRSTFFVGADGQKHVIAGPGREQIVCAWNDTLVVDDGKWRRQTAAERRAPGLNAECSRRIRNVLSDTTQKNLTAYAADLALRGELSSGDEVDVVTMRAARAWIMAMLGECRRVIASGEAPQWPPLPEGVSELAERF